MVKNDLRERGYYSVEKMPKHSGISAVWAILTIFIIVVTFFSIFFIVGQSQSEDKELSMIAYMFENIMTCLVILIAALFLYLYIKLALTLFFCSDRDTSVKLKFLEIKAMPVCFCREAFKVWQTIVIYLVPAAIIYVIVFIMCVLAEASAGALIILFFMSFFMAFDLTLVIYVIYLRIKDKAEYISIDQHIYDITLYNKTYIRVNKKAGK